MVLWAWLLSGRGLRLYASLPAGGGLQTSNPTTPFVIFDVYLQTNNSLSILITGENKYSFKIMK